MALRPGNKGVPFCSVPGIAQRCRGFLLHSGVDCGPAVCKSSALSIQGRTGVQMVRWVYETPKGAAEIRPEGFEFAAAFDGELLGRSHYTPDAAIAALVAHPRTAEHDIPMRSTSWKVTS